MIIEFKSKYNLTRMELLVFTLVAVAILSFKGIVENYPFHQPYYPYGYGYRRYMRKLIKPFGYGYRPYFSHRRYLYSHTTYPNYHRPITISDGDGNSTFYGHF